MNKFQKLEGVRDLSPVEISRIPLIKRSYEKQSEMLDGKNFVCRQLYGENLDKNPYCYGYDKTKASKGLSLFH